MKLTEQMLIDLNACPEGIQQFKKLKTKTVESTIKTFLKTDHKEKFNYSNWLITNLLSKEDCIRYAIFGAESVLPIFESKFPEDNRPRNAIEAAKAYLVNPSEENRTAIYAAAYAARSAVSAAYNAAYAVSAAYNAASAAYWAAYTACAISAASAAYYATAFDTAYAAYAASAAIKDKEEMWLKILNYGLSLIEKEEKRK